MDTKALLGRARQLRHLLDRLLACRPAGTAGASRVVRAALQPLLADSFRVYSDVARVLAVLLDRFFDTMDYPECVKAFETCVGTAKQIDALREFYDWCDDAGVARAADLLFPDVRRVDDKLLGTMKQFLRHRGQAGRAEAPRSARESDVNARGDGDDIDDMNGIKALPAPPARSSGGERARPATVVVTTKEADQSVLVDLREPAATADEQGNKLALALFATPPAATTGNNNNWVTFASESDAEAPTVTSAWQTPAAEPGKADWELALVETASNLSKQTASLGGGMDTLLLGGMYDQGAVRQHVAAQAASGSASSVALLPPGGRQAAPPVLMLPGPDGGTVQAVGGDPFAASLAVPPPSYVQMAEMERKQQLLVQEQQMWAQYRQGGMQGQPAGFNAVAGMPVVPYGGYGMPPTAYNQVGGYY